MAEAELARFIDRNTIEYVRTYPHPIERVWRAITDPAEFRAWFIPGALEPRAGGAYRFGPEGSTDFAGVVLEIESPRYIRFGDSNHPDGYFQYELAVVPEGARMRFIQHFPKDGAYVETPDDLGGDLPGGPGTPWKPGFVGGWHEFWDALGDYLDGVATGSRLPPTEFGAITQSFARNMVRSGRMTEVQAKRLVLGLRRQERWNELNKIYRAHIRATIPPT